MSRVLCQFQICITWKHSGSGSTAWRRRALPVCLPATTALQSSSGCWHDAQEANPCCRASAQRQDPSEADFGGQHCAWGCADTHCQVYRRFAKCCHASLRSGPFRKVILPHATHYSVYCRAARIPMYAPIHSKVSLITHADKCCSFMLTYSLNLNMLLCVEAYWVAIHLARAG